MSTLKIEDQFALKVNQELSEQLDAIIQKIGVLADNFSIGAGEKRSANSPFKNVLSVALEPPTSLEVIKGFIRYQVGRKGASEIWKKKDGFANALVQDLEGLDNDVTAILSRIKSNYEVDKIESQKMDSQDNPSFENPMIVYINNNEIPLKKSLHLQLAQQYLGYLSREHIARKGDSNFRKT